MAVYLFVSSEIYKLKIIEYYGFGILAAAKLALIIRQFRPNSAAPKWILGLVLAGAVVVSVLATDFYFVFSTWFFIHVVCALFAGVSTVFFFLNLRTQLILIYYKAG